MEELRRRNCLLMEQDGAELWDVVGDLGYFLFYQDGLPDRRAAQRQARVRARDAATAYCADIHAAKAPAQPERASSANAGFDRRRVLRSSSETLGIGRPSSSVG